MIRHNGYIFAAVPFLILVHLLTPLPLAIIHLNILNRDLNYSYPPAVCGPGLASCGTLVLSVSGWAHSQAPH